MIGNSLTKTRHGLKKKVQKGSGPVLESKGMRAIFQEKGKKMLKKGKKGQNI